MKNVEYNARINSSLEGLNCKKCVIWSLCSKVSGRRFNNGIFNMDNKIHCTKIFYIAITHIMSENIVSSFTYPIQHVCCIKKNAGRKRLALVDSLHKSKKRYM